MAKSLKFGHELLDLMHNLLYDKPYYFIKSPDMGYVQNAKECIESENTTSKAKKYYQNKFLDS